MPKHALIVGAGVIGLCTAYALSRRGWRVTIVDRNSPVRDGCSFGNAGMIVPSHFVPLAAPGMVGTALRMMLDSRSPFFIRPRLDHELFYWGWQFQRAATSRRVGEAAPLLRDLNLASRVCYEELAQVPGNDFGLVKKGLLMLCKTDHGFEEESRAAEMAIRLGIPANILSAQQAAMKEPDLQMNIKGAIEYPMDCHLSPHRFMASLIDRLTGAGAAFRWQTDVTGWRVKNGEVAGIRLSDHTELSADEYVLCGGVWSPQLAQQLHLRLPMQPGKGYSLTLSHPPRLPRTCAILTEARVAVTPMGSSLRIGGTMELSGLNQKIEPARVEGIIRSVPSYYPEFSPADFSGITPWVGLRPCSPDGLPYLGRTRQWSNLSLATGHAMMGISLAPITGKLLAEVLAGETPQINLRLLSPDRYAKG